jgi:AcrR family transcriptional regulator
LSSQPQSSTRRLGRPRGGGNEPEQAKEALLDAAERALSKHGYHASTMAVIAEEAGYTRTMAYRHFATRGELIEAVVRRVTVRQVAKIADRASDGEGQLTTLAAMITEGFIVVATELARDPLYILVAEQTERGSVAQLFVNAERYLDFIVAMLEQKVAEEGEIFREGLRLVDVARFLLSSALSMLLGLVADSDDPEQVRRYVNTFVLPAVMADPPPPAAEVFSPPASDS